jgi:hypothetical protein
MKEPAPTTKMSAISQACSDPIASTCFRQTLQQLGELLIVHVVAVHAKNPADERWGSSCTIWRFTVGRGVARFGLYHDHRQRHGRVEVWRTGVGRPCRMARTCRVVSNRTARHEVRRRADRSPTVNWMEVLHERAPGAGRGGNGAVACRTYRRHRRHTPDARGARRRAPQATTGESPRQGAEAVLRRTGHARGGVSNRSWVMARRSPSPRPRASRSAFGSSHGWRRDPRLTQQPPERPGRIVTGPSGSSPCEPFECGRRRHPEATSGALCPLRTIPRQGRVPQADDLALGAAAHDSRD